MTLSVGDRLPSATFLEMSDDGPREVAVDALFPGRRVVLVAMPGAFTPTCDGAHLPSFVRTAARFAERGVDEIVCVAVNDPLVMRVWGRESGAAAAGIRMLSDAAGGFTRAVGMDFDAPEVGFFGRSKRYAAVVEDGVVTLLRVEEARSACELTAGETLLEALEGAA